VSLGFANSRFCRRFALFALAVVGLFFVVESKDVFLRWGVTVATVGESVIIFVETTALDFERGVIMSLWLTALFILFLTELLLLSLLFEFVIDPNCEIDILFPIIEESIVVN